MWSGRDGTDGPEIKAAENLSVDNWPAWKDGQLPNTIAPTMGDIRQSAVSIIFPSPEFAAIDIAIPLQGVIEEDWVRHPTVTRTGFELKVAKNVLELTVANRAQNKEKGGAAPPSQPTTLAVLVFRKRIDQAALQEIADKTGKWPVLFSPDGKHQLRLTHAELTPKELLQKAQALVRESSELIAIVTTIVRNKRRNVAAKKAAERAEKAAARRNRRQLPNS